MRRKKDQDEGRKRGATVFKEISRKSKRFEGEKFFVKSKIEWFTQTLLSIGMKNIL